MIESGQSDTIRGGPVRIESGQSDKRWTSKDSKWTVR